MFIPVNRVFRTFVRPTVMAVAFERGLGGQKVKTTEGRREVRIRDQHNVREASVRILSFKEIAA